VFLRVRALRGAKLLDEPKTEVGDVGD
jgi:hypothetical protein